MPATSRALMLARVALHNVRGTLADRVLLVGLGKERDFRDKEFRQAIRSAVKLLNETGSYEAVLYVTEEKVKRREVAWRVEHAVVVAMEAVYRFDQMKSQPAEVRRPLRGIPEVQSIDESRDRVHVLRAVDGEGDHVANVMRNDVCPIDLQRVEDIRNVSGLIHFCEAGGRF